MIRVSISNAAVCCSLNDTVFYIFTQGRTFIYCGGIIIGNRWVVCNKTNIAYRDALLGRISSIRSSTAIGDGDLLQRAIYLNNDCGVLIT